MGEQGSFNPALFGFEDTGTKKVKRITKPDGCYVKLTDSGGRTRCRLTLDGVTAKSVHESFGDRVSVATDKRGALMLHRGSSFKLGEPSRRTGSRSIAVESLASTLRGLLGECGNHHYDVVWDSDEMVILNPRTDLGL